MKNKGFTLIELLVVIVIIAILAAILFPVYGRITEGARTANCASNLKQLAIVLRGYIADNEGYTPPIYWVNPLSDPIDPLDYPTAWIASHPWVSILNPVPEIVKCPSDEGGGNISYGFNRFLWSWKPACNVLKNPNGTINWAGTMSAIRINEIASTGERTINYPTKTITFFDWRSGQINDPESPSDIEDRREGWAGFPAAGHSSSRRHNGRANYAFWDGHVETLPPSKVKPDSTGGLGSDVYYVGRATLMPWYKNNEPWYDPGLLNGSPSGHTYACSVNRWAAGSSPAGTWPTFNIFR